MTSSSSPSRRSSLPDPLLSILEDAQQAGLLGPGPVARHVELAEAFLEASAPPASAVDLGSGGGVPGLVLAAAWPGSAWVLVDRSVRRTAFLRRAVAVLGWAGRVEVATGEAEAVGTDPTQRGRHDLVVARSFGPPAVTAECGAPFLQVGGRLLVTEPPEPAARRWSEPGLARLGLNLGPLVTGTARVQVLEQVTPCPETYPRRAGLPAKKPLW